MEMRCNTRPSSSVLLEVFEMAGAGAGAVWAGLYGGLEGIPPPVSVVLELRVLGAGAWCWCLVLL